MCEFASQFVFDLVNESIHYKLTHGSKWIHESMSINYVLLKYKAVFHEFISNENESGLGGGEGEVKEWVRARMHL